MALKYSILGLLHYRDMHGYEIKKHIERHFGHMWSINYGQIYPNLKKMLAEGLVRMKEDPNPGKKGPLRKVYAITKKGKEDFERWIGSSPERGMLLRDPFLMRFVFFGFGKADAARRIVEEQIEIYEAQLKQRQENMGRWERHDLYVRQMARLGLRLNEIFLDWLRESRELIEKGEERV